MSALESRIAELEQQRGKKECVQEWEHRNADGSAKWGVSVVMCEDGYIDRRIESIQEEIENLQHTYQSNKVEQSYLGQIGKFIEPLFTPMDFDWKLSISLVNGLLAKETIISSMGVLYALGEVLMRITICLCVRFFKRMLVCLVPLLLFCLLCFITLVLQRVLCLARKQVESGLSHICLFLQVWCHISLHLRDIRLRS